MRRQPCRAELPAVQKLHDSGRGHLAPFVSENDYSFPVWMARPVFESLRPMGGAPMGWFVDAHGTVVWEQTGFAAPAADTWVKEMLARPADLAGTAQ